LCITNLSAIDILARTSNTSALYETNTLTVGVYSVRSLKQQPVCRHMSLYSDTILIPNQPCQSLFLFLTAACLAKNQPTTNVIIFGLTDRDLNPQPITPEASTLNNTSPMRFRYHGVSVFMLIANIAHILIRYHVQSDFCLRK
jgi:hypothetical protein